MIRAGEQTGFSLLEVLVAFAILALSLGVLAQIFSSSMRNTQLSAGYSEAMMVAESQLALLADEPEEGSDGGESGRYRWESEISHFDLDDGFRTASKLLQLEVTVTWDEYGRERQVSLTTLRMAPDNG